MTTSKKNGCQKKIFNIGMFWCNIRQITEHWAQMTNDILSDGLSDGLRDGMGEKVS